MTEYFQAIKCFKNSPIPSVTHCTCSIQFANDKIKRYMSFSQLFASIKKRSFLKLPRSNENNNIEQKFYPEARNVTSCYALFCCKLFLEQYVQGRIQKFQKGGGGRSRRGRTLRFKVCFDAPSHIPFVFFRWVVNNKHIVNTACWL